MSNPNDRKGIRELIHDAVDRTTETVHNIHQTIAAAPYDALTKADALEQPAIALREVQETVTDAVYGTIRKINREVQRLGDDLLTEL